MKPKISHSLIDSLNKDGKLMNYRYTLYVKVRNQYYNNVEFIDSKQIMFEDKLNYYSFNGLFWDKKKFIIKPINLPSR